MKNFDKKEKEIQFGEIMLPGTKLNTLITSVIEKVDILYKLPDENVLEMIKIKLNRIKKLLVVKLTPLTAEEFDPIFNEIENLYTLSKQIDRSAITEDFVRLYEGFYILKEIEFQLNNKNLDLKLFCEKYRKSIKEEPNRKNVLGNLLQLVKDTLIIN